MRAVIALLLVSCYGPSYQDCEVSCATGAGCPSGLTCDQTLGKCRVAGAGQTCGSTSEDGTVADTPVSTCWPIVPTNFDPCASDFPASTGPETLSGPLNSDDPTQVARRYVFNGTPMVLHHVDSLMVPAGALVPITGALPFLYVVDGDAEIDGIIFPRSSAAPAVDCTARTGAAASGTGAGGGGGGHAMPGAAGGPSGDGAAGGMGGVLLGDTMAVPLRAGCPGAAGGFMSLTGAGGAGGGGFEISVKGTLTIKGSIQAGGVGGQAGVTDAAGVHGGGGGGGGAGGTIIVEAGGAIVLDAAGQLCAAGGGGGEGAPTNAAAATQKAGGVGSCVAGGGGASSTFGGDGGTGSTGATSATLGQQGSIAPNIAGGGGGGGAAGRIRIHTPSKTLAGRVVPDPI